MINVSFENPKYESSSFSISFKTKNKRKDTESGIVFEKTISNVIDDLSCQYLNPHISAAFIFIFFIHNPLFCNHSDSGNVRMLGYKDSFMIYNVFISFG